METVPEDVKEWVGEGGQLASRRVEAVVEYVAPRLTQLTSSLARVQQRLAETAEDTLDSVPTLEKLVEELQETLDVARYISFRTFKISLISAVETFYNLGLPYPRAPCPSRPPRCTTL